MIPFPVADLSPIVEGGDAAPAFRNTTPRRSWRWRHGKARALPWTRQGPRPLEPFSWSLSLIEGGVDAPDPKRPSVAAADEPA